MLKPIRFVSVRRNEVAEKASAANAQRAMKAGTTAGLGIDVAAARQQRASLLLADVAYVIEARFERTARAEADDTDAKHISMFNRRARAGQCFHQPCLGTREFPAAFALLDDGDALPASTLPDAQRDRDLGWMTLEPPYAGGEATFFRAALEGGVLEVAKQAARGLAA